MAARQMSGPAFAATRFEWSSAASLDRLHERLSVLDNVDGDELRGRGSRVPSELRSMESITFVRFD
jgi:hypothetical protein